MQNKFKEYILWIVVAIILGVIGGGMWILTMKLIDYTAVTACFDYHDPEVCAEAINRFEAHHAKD